MSYCRLPAARIGPKTELSLVVLQFQRRSWSWCWHSPMPMRTPRATLAMWSEYSWHIRRWPALSPSSWMQLGAELPSTSASALRHSSLLCIARLLTVANSHTLHPTWDAFPYTENSRCKIWYKLVLITNRKSHMRFRLVPNSVTLNDLERRTGRYIAFTEFIKPALQITICGGIYARVFYF